MFPVRQWSSKWRSWPPSRRVHNGEGPSSLFPPQWFFQGCHVRNLARAAAALRLHRCHCQAAQSLPRVEQQQTLYIALDAEQALQSACSSASEDCTVSSGTSTLCIELTLSNFIWNAQAAFLTVHSEVFVIVSVNSDENSNSGTDTVWQSNRCKKINFMLILKPRTQDKICKQFD